MLDKAKYLWKFRPFGPKKKEQREEILWSHSMVSMAQLAGAYDAEMVLGYERDAHRRAVAEKLAQAVYDGWLPYDVEWWEGPYDDRNVLREYDEHIYTDCYHFWTKIRLTCITYPLMKRNAPESDITITAYHPGGLK